MGPTEEQRLLADGLRRFLDAAGGLAPAHRAAAGAAEDPALWEGLALGMGLAGLAVAPAHGGLGLGMAELCLVAEELGRVLSPAPFVAVVGLAVPVLALAATGPAAAGHLVAAAGGARIALAAEGFANFRAEPTAGGYRLAGSGPAVAGLAGAGTILIPASLGGAAALFALGAGPGLTVETLPALDPTRPLARLTLAAAVPAAARIDGPGTAADFIAALDRARLAHAAEAVGAARGAFALTMGHIAARVQFGRTIASFQAVKHRMAALFVRINSAAALVAGAAAAFDAGEVQAGAEARAAWAMARRVLAESASETIQLQGGVGLTWEHPAHLFFKRSVALAHVLGPAAEAEAALGRDLADGRLPCIPAAPAADAFRARVAAWVGEHLAGRFAPLRHRGGAGDGDALVDLRKEWERELARAGWVGLGLPRSAGGQGLPVAGQVAFHEEYARAGGPGRMGHIGEGLVAPTLLAFGTPAQQARHLPGILAGTAFWAQGYSEPGAGSDLAALTTRARRCPDSGDWLVTGQKVWTSLAHVADWIFVLARAVEGSTGREGLIFLLLPLHQPGITVRPIRQINGGAEFNEVFLDGARARADDAVGSPGEGWRVATALLGFERGISTLGQQMGFARELAEVAATASEAGTAAELADVLGRAWSGLRAMRHGALAMLSAQAEGRAGPEMLGYKLEWSTWHRALGELALAAMGPAAALWSDDQTRARLQHMALFARAETIYGGTSEIQLNLIAERGLGMPREPRGTGR
ncbi:MAG: acyl-CoA dehydrogenase [Rhodobacteraceae bacterium]|jgi:alkylation response protein AidB-like acyl-CoA dehydrogenase|nr:acyl-CoA dehydrogenase [Paracoccaceae bacterium]